MDIDVTGYSYDPENGKFYNRHGREVGSFTKKYGRVIIGTKHVSMGRLAVKLMTGKWPPDQVDHIDGNCHNNKWDNLRVCSRNQNMKNRNTYTSNTSGYKGVYPIRYKQRISYGASIQTDGKRIFIGSFKTALDAAKAYNEKALELHGEFARLNEIGE